MSHNLGLTLVAKHPLFVLSFSTKGGLAQHGSKRVTSTVLWTPVDVRNLCCYKDGDGASKTCKTTFAISDFFVPVRVLDQSSMP